MRVGGCLLLVFTLAWSFLCVYSESPSVMRKKRHLFPLMGFLQGYKMGQDFALQLPPFVLSPMVIFPANQQKSIHIEGITNEKYDENSSFNQVVLPEKLIQSNSTDNPEIHDKSVSSGLIQNSVKLPKDDVTEEETFRQIISNDTLPEGNVSKDNNNVTTTEITISSEPLNITSMTTPYGPYPSAIYKNDKIATLTITESPINHDFKLPSTDNNWKNFSSNVPNELQVESRPGGVWTNDITYSKRDFTRDSYYYNDNKPNVDSYYRRPANPLNQERWSSNYLGDNKLTSEFRPLAGLYYDGFLHKPPTMKTGFLPYGNTYY